MQNCCVIRLKLYLQTFRKHGGEGVTCAQYWRQRIINIYFVIANQSRHLFYRASIICRAKWRTSVASESADTGRAAHIVIFSGSITTCFSSISRPPPKIIWWKDGKKIYDDDNEYHLPREHFNRLLFIDEVSKEHQGNYTCTAVSASEMERVSASTFLTVKGLFWSRLLLLMRGKPVPFSDILSESIKPMN